MAFQPPTLCPSHPSSSRPTEKKVVQALLYRIGFCAVQNLIRYSQDWMAFSWYWREWIKKFSRAVRIRNKEMKYSTPTRKRHLAYTINRSFPSCLWSLLKKARPKCEAINMKIIFLNSHPNINRLCKEGWLILCSTKIDSIIANWVNTANNKELCFSYWYLFKDCNLLITMKFLLQDLNQMYLQELQLKEPSKDTIR